MASSLVEFGVGGVISAILHPTGYAKTLIQLGHEPLQPVLCKKFIFLGKDAYCYPNILQYSRYIYQTDGFLGMYKGLVPRLTAGYLGNYVYAAVLKELRKEEKNKDDDDECGDSHDWVKIVVVETSQETVAKVCAVIASQPFHVLMVRQMAQFVGGETQYDGFFGGLAEIYKTDGIKGFFAGLIPRLVGEVAFIWITKMMATFINRYIVESKETQGYMTSFCGFITMMFTYRFSLISNIMAVSGTELIAASPPKMRPFTSWLDCYSFLSATGNLKRGSGAFFRYTRHPGVYSASHGPVRAPQFY